MTLFFLLLPVICYHVFPDFGLQFLFVIILQSLTSYLKGCRFPGKVYTNADEIKDKNRTEVDSNMKRNANIAHDIC